MNTWVLLCFAFLIIIIIAMSTGQVDSNFDGKIYQLLVSASKLGKYRYWPEKVVLIELYKKDKIFIFTVFVGRKFLIVNQKIHFWHKNSKKVLCFLRIVTVCKASHYQVDGISSCLLS